MFAMTIVAAITVGIFLCQWLYINAGWLAMGLQRLCLQALAAIAHPSTTSPVTFVLLFATVLALAVGRRFVVAAMVSAAIATVPLMTFLGVMSILIPPRIGGSRLEVGNVEFHDWSGIFQQRRSDATHAFDVKMAEGDAGPGAARYCRQLIDQDSIGNMPKECALLACDRIKKGTIETDARTMTLAASGPGRTRDHRHVASVCESLRY